MATYRACEDALHTSLPCSPPLSSNVGSPHGSGHDFDGMGTRSGSNLDEKLDALLSKFVHFEAQIAQIPALTTWMSRMDLHISKTLGDFAGRLSEMEQNFSAITARMCKFETYAASASNVSGSAKSWPTLEHVDGSTAAGSHAPGSSDDNRNTRRRLDPPSSAEDEQSRSAVLFRLPCGQYLKGVTQWIDTLWDESGMLACNKPTRIHCKAGSVSVRLVFETRGKCQDFIVRYKDDDILYAINSPLCCTNTTITVRQSRTIEEREIGKQFMPLWKELADQFKVLLPDADDKGVFIIPALDSRSQILSIKDRRNGIGKPVFKLAPLGCGQTFMLVAFCLFLVFRMRCYNGFSLKPTGLMCDGRSFASPFLRRLAGRGAFFCGFLVRWVLRFVSHLVRGFTLREWLSGSRESPLSDCDRPCDPLSCLLFTALWLRCSQTLVMQETSLAQDAELTCSLTSLFEVVTCLPIGPMSLVWPASPFDGNSCPSLPPDAPGDGLRRVVLAAPERSR